MLILARFLAFSIIAGTPTPDDPATGVKVSPSVPAAAVQAAQKCLVEDWMVRCKAEPAFYGQDEKTDLAAAVLEEEPFVEYFVGENQLRQFAASSSVDPREFASLTKYTFPILIHGEYKGGLIIVGNLDGDGNVIRAGMPPGAYVCSEFLGPGGLMEEYRVRFPPADGYHVSFVSIVGGPLAILVTDRSNALFVLEGEVLIPFADAGKQIRDSAVAILQRQDSDW